MYYDPQIDRNMARAHALRAEYLANLVRHAWGGIKRLARRMTFRPTHYATPSRGPRNCSA